MKKLIALIILLQLGSVSASLVAIMDSGVDISHKDIENKLWTNLNEIEGSTVDNDFDELPGNVHGWDYTEKRGKVFDDKYYYLLTPDVLKVNYLYGKYQLNTITKVEYDWLSDMMGNREFMKQYNFVSTYSHGTHCAGISLLNNPSAKVMSLKILTTKYENLNVDIVSKNKDNSAESEVTVAELKDEIIKMSYNHVTDMRNINFMLVRHKVDVINQSFGTNVDMMAGFVKSLFNKYIKREPTNAELANLLAAYFSTHIENGKTMFETAPWALFVVAAGNDSNNNDILPVVPANVKADNKITVAATVDYSSLAEFSNYGKTTVDVAAPGVAILSTGPNQNYLRMSGTSMAAPFVTNVAAKIKDTNPHLFSEDIKAILIGTVDFKAWLVGKVASAGIVNEERALRAAKYTLDGDSVQDAIVKAVAFVDDVPTPKSFGKRPSKMKLNYKPILPSLFIDSVR